MAMPLVNYAARTNRKTPATEAHPLADTRSHILNRHLLLSITSTAGDPHLHGVETLEITLHRGLLTTLRQAHGIGRSTMNPMGVTESTIATGEETTNTAKGRPRAGENLLATIIRPRTG